MNNEPWAAAPLVFKCPFCGGRAGVTRDPPAVVHSFPLCDMFGLDPVDYLRAVNEQTSKNN
jgi:hypothetical protein